MSPPVSSTTELQFTAPSSLRASIDETFGAFLIGTIFAVMYQPLYGMTIHQVYQYFRLHSDGERWNKYLVCALTYVDAALSSNYQAHAVYRAMETFHVILCTHACYYYLVRNYGNWDELAVGVWSINLLTALSGLSIILSQSFFARRVYLISTSYRVVVLVAVVLLIGEFGFFVGMRVGYVHTWSGHSHPLSPQAGTVQAFALPLFVHFEKFTWLISAGAAMAVVADGLLTSILVTVLRKNMTGIKRMDTIVDILILYTVTTGLLTGFVSSNPTLNDGAETFVALSLVNLLSFIFSLLCPNNLIYTAFGVVSTKLYANSLLAALNSRKYLANRAAGNFYTASLFIIEDTRMLPLGMPPRSPRHRLCDSLELALQTLYSRQDVLALFQSYSLRKRLVIAALLMIPLSGVLDVDASHTGTGRPAPPSVFSVPFWTIWGFHIFVYQYRITIHYYLITWTMFEECCLKPCSTESTLYEALYWTLTRPNTGFPAHHSRSPSISLGPPRAMSIPMMQRRAT
ncbi:hypothetical protein NUW54_g5168 [Trametes sanguinea]|uniref:Uncharacterized protein n=1 Tax=Trametes sanguinea TaxID=158606 RepID=A0ACC1PX54_9APHY|nr:hypothetical protein NUW54_g5168 [Trametes sanguinea]